MDKSWNSRVFCFLFFNQGMYEPWNWFAIWDLFGLVSVVWFGVLCIGLV